MFIIIACLLRELSRICQFDLTKDSPPYTTARARLDHHGDIFGAPRVAICKGASALEGEKI